MGAQLAGRFPASGSPASWYLRTRLLLAVWAVLSVFWITGVGYEIYRQVSTQADMSRAVERDLDQGFVAASCVGAGCGARNTAAARPVPQTESLTDILMTYIRFDSDEMAATVFGPPGALLVVGLGAVAVLRRRRTAAAKAARLEILAG